MTFPATVLILIVVYIGINTIVDKVKEVINKTAHKQG